MYIISLMLLGMEGKTLIMMIFLCFWLDDDQSKMKSQWQRVLLLDISTTYARNSPQILQTSPRYISFMVPIVSILEKNTMMWSGLIALIIYSIHCCNWMCILYIFIYQVKDINNPQYDYIIMCWSIELHNYMLMNKINEVCCEHHILVKIMSTSCISC